MRALFGAAGELARRSEGGNGAPARRHVRVRQHARLSGRTSGRRRPHARRRFLDRPDRRDGRAVRRVRAGDRLRDRGRAAGRRGGLSRADARRTERARPRLVVVGEGRVVAPSARPRQRRRRTRQPARHARHAARCARVCALARPRPADRSRMGIRGQGRPRRCVARRGAARCARQAGRQLLAGPFPVLDTAEDGHAGSRRSAATRRTASGSTT